MGKIVSGLNDLRTANSEVAEQWHPTRNGRLSPEQVAAGSNKKAWWKRECIPGVFHEWEAVIYSRALSNIGCPVCAGKLILVGHNDLVTTHPILAEQWHPTMNGSITATEITAGSGKKAWWKRECIPGIFHEWDAVVVNRTSLNSGCPICAGKLILVGYNDLDTTHPILTEQWHKTKNGVLSPKKITAGSHKKTWWERECSPGIFHEWEAAVSDRASLYAGCSVCSGGTVLVGYNDLGTTNPALAAEWHMGKNGLLTPEQVTSGSSKKVWWERECSPGVFHEWDAVIHSRNSNGHGCSICAGKLILVGYNDLGTTHPILTEQWHPNKNGSLTPKKVTSGASKKVWWERECSPGIFHEWEASVNNRALGNAGCPVCFGRTVLVGYNDLGTTNPALAAEWHMEKNGLLTPEQVTSGSGKKVWWERECSPGVFHEWVTAVSHRALRNTGCSLCSTGKTEKLFRESFVKQTGYYLQSSCIQLDRLSRLTNRARIDMLNDDLKLVIEYDGAWAHGKKLP